MFKKSRSKRANRNAQTQQAHVPPTSAAAIAALQATGAQSIQDGRLAAGAAAAALRSRTSSPVNVGDVQTRRTMRRASMTSETSNASRPVLSRSGSQSSMTSRTFRSPSPHGRTPAVGNTPPVPPIPRSGATSPSSMIARSFRRPASTEPAARVVSPTPQDGYRNMSVDAVTKRTSKPVPIKTSNLGDLTESNGGRNSVNFSRPMSPENRPLSPSPTSPTSSTALAKMGYKSTSSSRDGSLDDLEYKYQEVANKPVHKKKGLGGDEGSHLAAGTMGAKATGTAVDDSPAPRPKRIPLPRRITEEDEEEEFEEVFDPHTRKMIKRRKPGRKPKPSASAPLVASPTLSSPPRQRETAPAPNTARPAPAPAPKQESPARQLQSAAAAAAILPPETRSRDVSTSPARKARFSLRPEESPSMHEPARSLTPTKSALRKSPSPRGLSPADSVSKRASWNQPGFNSSEVSESASHLSDDRPKRRSVRVSFDERPTIVGTSATPPTGAESPTVTSPQHEKKKNNWFGLRKNKATSEESEEGLAPTPALPSFGSVRGRRPTSEEDVEPTTGVLGIPGVALTTGEQTPSEAGSRVDETDDKEHTTSTMALRQEEQEQLNGSVKKMKSGDVPMIAVIPGTPGVDNEENPLASPKEEGQSPPSPVQDTNPAALGISEPEPEEAAAAHDPSTPVVGHVRDSIQQQTEQSDKLETDSQDSHYSDAPEDVDGDGFGSINAIVESPSARPESPRKKLAESLPPLTEEPPTEILPVSAAEADQGAEPTTYQEATAAKDDGKQEKKAEKENTPPTGPSPASLSPSPPHQKSPLESISYSPRRMNSTSSNRDISPDGPKRFSENRTALGSDTRSRPEGAEAEEQNEKPLPQSGPYPKFERSPRQSFQDLARSTSTSPDISQATSSNTPQKITDAASSTSASTPARSASEKKPLKSALKQTNRTSVPPEASPSSQQRGALQKKGRPTSAAPAATSQPSEAVMLAKAMAVVQERRAKEAKEKEADVQATLQRARATSLGSTAAPASKRSSFAPPVPKLRRRGSGDSDSSFKRGPSSVTSEGGRVTMRRSMRSNPPARPQSMVSSGSVRQSMRSTPSQRSRPTSMVGGGMSSRSMRREPSPPRSILGLKKPQRSASVQNSGSRRQLASRFDVDSDDEDLDVPAFSSRFGGRGDEQPGKLRPVRGIPHRTEEVDSSDLDSDGELPARVSSPAPTHDDRLMEMARQRLGIEARPEVPPIEHKDSFGQNDLVEAFTEKKAEKKSRRASIFGSLSRRKNQDKVAKSKEESIARKDTHLERNILQRRNTGQASLTSTPERPGASRQTTAERIATLRSQVDPGSWPLPESPGVDRRPDTSDGSPPTTVVERPAPRRQISADSAVYGRSGKKKRFPLLRRAFGLHD